MSDWQMKIIIAEADRLIALAEGDAALRADLRSLAESILAATNTPQPADAPRAPSSAPETSEPLPLVANVAEAGEENVAEADQTRSVEPLRELTLGRSTRTLAETRHVPGVITGPGIADTDLTILETNSRRKADAARWAAERQLRIREGTYLEVETPPMEQEALEWADKLTDCFYWTSTSQPADFSLLDDLGGCFETLAEAIALIRDIPDDLGSSRRRFEHAIPLIAESQSAVRAAIQNLQAPDDPDQLQVFEWLKTTAARHQIYIKRFMRADDHAIPTRWGDLLSRIEAADEKYGNRRPPRYLAWLDRIRSHANLVREGKASEQDWPSIIETVEEMVTEGVPPSNREIRELLLPILDDLPDVHALPASFQLVLREIDRCLATRTPPSVTSAPHAPTAEVKEAARLLGGRSVVLIGGVRRRDAGQVLKGSLGLKELIWIETKEHQSIQGFAPSIARPDVALVLLAIRWSSHAFGDVRQFCDRYDKPLVRLPGGYNPNQVATQILSQSSGRLGAD